MTTTAAKFNMIEQQIRPWEVLDPHVLAVINEVNREDFVREVYRGLAYADCQIPVADGVRMLPPTVEGRMLQALNIDSADEILEVGSGCGYLAACLAKLGQRVTSIDRSAGVIEFAAANIAASGIDNVEFRQLSPAEFDAPQSCDVIAVTASLPEVPENLRQALRPGGRMFVIVGESPVMEALLVTRAGESEWLSRSLFETDLPRLQLQASSVQRMNAPQLAAYLAHAEPLLLDVREPWEFDICHIEGSINLPMAQIPARLEQLDEAEEIVLICHHGIRSLKVAGYLQQAVDARLINLDGGVDAWAREVDTDMALY